tara:strand:+ start:175 stop:672 length:498 start_codon:yes stop_codon:yes gene_type:complete
MKYIKELGLLAFLLTFITSVSVWAACSGCGEEGHEQCLEGDDHNHATSQEHEHIEGGWLDHKHIEEGAMSNPPEVVFAVCVFADGTLVDHKGANSMSDCLKTKRTVEKKWKNKAATTDTIEINGITYQIDGESLAFMCDLVDAQVHHYEDGSWEIIEILGKHKSE